MNRTPRPVPSGSWLVFGTVGFLALAGLFVHDTQANATAAADAATDRAVVLGMLGPLGGAPIALPVVLPPRYRVPDSYEWGTDGTGAVDSRRVDFMPTEDALLHDRLPWVTVCVEAVAYKEHRCSVDRTTIERHTRTARIVIGFSRDPADHRDPAGTPANRAAWRSVEFTTDLDQVRWLH